MKNLLAKTTAIALMGVLLLSGAHAANIPAALQTSQAMPELSARSWVLMEPETGWILAEKEADKRIEPASLTKLMTIYIAFDRLASEQLSLDEQVTISEKAWRTEGSRMFAEVNSEISVLKLLKSIIIQSGNDASVALAEHISGTEDAFAELMNETSAAMGLTNSSFRNSTGLPDPEHYSTARDIARLSGLLIQNFPQYYAWFSAREFKHNDIVQQNRNRLLWRSKLVDGLKTGHTESAGYCLAATAKKDDLRMIAVVTGTDSDQQRSDQAMALLRYGLANYEVSVPLSDESDVDKLRVYGGQSDYVGVRPLHSFPVVVPRGKAELLAFDLEKPNNVSAPVSSQQAIGMASITFDQAAIGQIPLVAASDVDSGSLLKRAIDVVKKMINDF